MNTLSNGRIDRLEDKIEIIKEGERQANIDMLLDDLSFLTYYQERIATAFNDYFELDEDPDQITDYIAEKIGNFLQIDDSPLNFRSYTYTEICVGGGEWIELTIEDICHALELTRAQLLDVAEDLDIGVGVHYAHIADDYIVYFDVSEIDITDYDDFCRLYTTIDDARIALENSGIYEMLPQDMKTDFINELFRGIHRKPESLYNQWVKTGKLED